MCRERYTMDQHTRRILCSWAGRVRETLLNCEPCTIIYPSGFGPNSWCKDQIKICNRNLLRQLKGKGNLYAIFLHENGSWAPKYVGQCKARDLRTRLTAHLIAGGQNTGKKLEKVQCAVGRGQQVGITYARVDPELLRHFVEGWIIAHAGQEELPWNDYGRVPTSR